MIDSSLNFVNEFIVHVKVDFLMEDSNVAAVAT